MAARYWRLTAPVTGGTALRLSEFAVDAAGVRLDLTATVSSSATPVAGSLSALNDDATVAEVEFSGEQCAARGFHITWDFGTPVHVSYAAPTCPDTGKRLFAFNLSYSDDGVVWTVEKYIWFKYTGSAQQPDGLPDPHYADALMLVPSYASVPGEYSFYQRRYTRTEAPGGEWNGYSERYYYTPGEVLDGDFTIEGVWVHYSVYVSSTPIMYIGASGWVIRALNSNIVIINPQGTTMGSVARASGSTPSLAAWVRSGSTNTFYVRGAVVSSWEDSTPVAMDYLRISVPNSAMYTYVNHARVTKGARYTAPFTENLSPTYIPPQATRSVSLAQPLATAGAGAIPDTTALAGPPPAFAKKYWWGIGTLTGSVKKLVPPDSTAPLARPVRLIDAIGMQTLGRGASDANGNFAFHNIDTEIDLAVIALDTEGMYRPAMVNGVRAK